MNKVNELIEQLKPIAADPKSGDALEVLSLFRSLRWELLELENLIMDIKFDKPLGVWCPECGGAINLGACVKCEEEFN